MYSTDCALKGSRADVDKQGREQINKHEPVNPNSVSHRMNEETVFCSDEILYIEGKLNEIYVFKVVVSLSDGQ
jgi:hypothetical protein